MICDGVEVRRKYPTGTARFITAIAWFLATVILQNSECPIMVSPDHSYIARLQNAIRQLHHCESKYIESVTVSGTFLFFQKRPIEESEVAVFEISDNPHAKRPMPGPIRQAITGDALLS